MLGNYNGTDYNTLWMPERDYTLVEVYNPNIMDRAILSQVHGEISEDELIDWVHGFIDSFSLVMKRSHTLDHKFIPVQCNGTISQCLKYNIKILKYDHANDYLLVEAMIGELCAVEGSWYLLDATTGYLEKIITDDQYKESYMPCIDRLANALTKYNV